MFVVAGVTGRTGSVVMQTLLAAGKRVRGLVRGGGRPVSVPEGLELCEVPTLTDADALASVLEGAEGAYFLLPTDPHSESFLADGRRAVNAIASAMERSGVPHVVHLSSIGAHLAGGTGPIRALHYAEQSLARTDSKVTFLRSALFLENWAAFTGAIKAGTLPTFAPTEMAYPMVAVADVGRVAAQALLDGPPQSQLDVIELAGTRELSANEVADIFAHLLERDVTPARVPADAIVPTLRSVGISGELSELYRELYQGLANDTLAWEGQDVVRGRIDPEDVLRAFV